ncbi:hypothetical protein HYZ99_00445, partial [Candidatus Peregrinibacteria bacterium]|nr:hypothetical protein [Candidatus Peregrinibacteria bacterium]
MDRSLHHLIAFAALAVITVGVYSAVFTHGFVDWDDPTLITQNPYVTEFSPKIFSTYDPELYVPLTLLTYQIEHAIAGLKPFLFHLDNLILHILNVLLVFLLFYTRTKDRALAFLGALIFAVHPLNVEAVAWVSARKESLMTFFFLTSILATQKSDRNWDKWHIGSIALFACSLLSKVTAAPLPLLLMFLDRRDGLSLRESLRKRWPYLLLALILGVVALFGKRGSIGLDPLSFVILAVQSIAFYIQKLLLPIDLAAFYSAPPITLSLQFFIALLTILFVCVVGWLLRRHQNVLFGLVFFLLTLAPSLFGYQKANEIALAADRYAYLPSIGWILFVGSLALLLKSNLRKIAAGVALVA